MREDRRYGRDSASQAYGIDVVEATGRDHRQHDGGTVGPRWLPAKVQLPPSKAMPLKARSAPLLVKQILPSSEEAGEVVQR